MNQAFPALTQTPNSWTMWIICCWKWNTDRHLTGFATFIEERVSASSYWTRSSSCWFFGACSPLYTGVRPITDLRATSLLQEPDWVDCWVGYRIHHTFNRLRLYFYLMSEKARKLHLLSLLHRGQYWELKTNWAQHFVPNFFTFPKSQAQLVLGVFLVRGPVLCTRFHGTTKRHALHHLLPLRCMYCPWFNSQSHAEHESDTSGVSSLLMTHDESSACSSTPFIIPSVWYALLWDTLWIVRNHSMHRLLHSGFQVTTWLFVYFCQVFPAMPRHAMPCLSTIHTQVLSLL